MKLEEAVRRGRSRRRRKEEVDCLANRGILIQLEAKVAEDACRQQLKKELVGT